jgi:hypothetical protein
MGNVLTLIFGVSGACAVARPAQTAAIETEASATQVRKPIRNRICPSLQSHVPPIGGDPACQNSSIVRRARMRSFPAPPRLSNGKARQDYKRLLLNWLLQAFRKALKLRNRQLSGQKACKNPKYRQNDRGS